MTQLSATFPSNQWPAHAFHNDVEMAAKELIACAGSTSIETNRQLILKGMTMLLPAGNA